MIRYSHAYVKHRPRRRSWFDKLTMSGAQLPLQQILPLVRRPAMRKNRVTLR